MPLQDITNRMLISTVPGQAGQPAAAPEPLKPAAKTVKAERVMQSMLIRKRQEADGAGAPSAQLDRKSGDAKGKSDVLLRHVQKSLEGLTLGTAAGAAAAATPSASGRYEERLSALVDFNTQAKTRPYYVGIATEEVVSAHLKSAKEGQWLLWGKDIVRPEDGILSQVAMLSFVSPCGIIHDNLAECGAARFKNELAQLHVQYPLAQSMHGTFYWDSSAIAKAIKQQFSAVESFEYDDMQAGIRAAACPGEPVIYKNRAKQNHFFIAYSLDSKVARHKDCAVYHSGHSDGYVVWMMADGEMREIFLDANFTNAVKSVLKIDLKAPQTLSQSGTEPKSFKANLDRYAKQYREGKLKAMQFLGKLDYMKSKATSEAGLGLVVAYMGQATGDIEKTINARNKDPYKAMWHHPFKVSFPAIEVPQASVKVIPAMPKVVKIADDQLQMVADKTKIVQKGKEYFRIVDGEVELVPIHDQSKLLAARDSVHAMLDGKPSGTWLLYENPISKKLCVLVVGHQLGASRPIQEFDAPPNCAQLHLAYPLHQNVGYLNQMKPTPHGQL